tara:strand:- start:5 stop:184 length:180 start_codon:yes stop_codon:yes gene_type:complete
VFFLSSFTISKDKKMNRRNVLKRKIEQIKKEQARKKFVEDTSRKFRLNMLGKSVGMVGA